ncbi:MAG: hypothetical protein JW839_01945 [Candidatus Lokiarchaeota archaeon]|nr:hypothetical protein [Candidatus Lokiarchaeota archaeon]
MRGTSEQKEKTARLPSAIIRIAKEPGARILVKGSPGTGKTSLALEIASTVSKAILVTRGWDASGIKARFPWLPMDDMAVLDVASWLGGDGLDNTTLPERVRVLGLQVSGLGTNFSEALVVIDDVCAFLSGLPRGDLHELHSSFLDVLSGTLRNPVLLISPEESSPVLESRADAVMALHDDLLDGRVMRLLDIVKLRGAARRSKRVPFTLASGRFVAGMLLGRVDIANAGRWIVSPDPPGNYSTGSEKVDLVYQECFKLASFNLMEIDPDLPFSASNFFLSPIINFLWQNRAVVLAPMTGINTILLGKNDFTLYVDAEMLASNFRVLEERTGTITECRPYLIQIENRERDLFKTFLEVYDSFMSKNKYSPLFSIIELTSLDYRNDVMLKQILNHAKFVKNANIIEFAIVNSGVDPEFKAQLASIATSHTKLHNGESGVTLFTGMQPRSPHFFVELDVPTIPKIRIIPVV